MRCDKKCSDYLNKIIYYSKRHMNINLLKVLPLTSNTLYFIILATSENILKVPFCECFNCAVVSALMSCFYSGHT